MVEAIGKNLWLLLTLVIPGLFTYGAWRAILLLEPSKRLPVNALGPIDNSALVTTCIIISIALLQQAFAIVVEAILSQLAKMMKRRWPGFYALFCERFELAAAGKFDENATRIIGNFFLSLNVCIGLCMLLLYFLAYEEMSFGQWVPRALTVLLAATLITTVFRMLDAEWVVQECKKKHRT